MDKLRHIHSKIGTETAYRIPVSVEGAIVEAVAAYDELQSGYDLACQMAEAETKRGDELAAKVERLMKYAVIYKSNLGASPRKCWDDDCAEQWRDIDRMEHEPLAASLLRHDAELIEQVRDGFESRHYDIPGVLVSPSRVYNWLSELASDFRSKQAAALEGEGDE